MIERVIDFDKEVFLAINSQHTEFWDMVMWHISAKYTWIPMYALMIFWFGWRYHWKAVWPVIATVLGFALADLASVHLFKDVFGRLRPCHDPEIRHLVHTVNNNCGGFYGFVSSHAANTFAIATVTSALFRHRYFSLWIFFWAALVSFSRIYLGRHFPADIVCGALLGILLGFAIIKMYRMIPLTRDLSGGKP